MRNKRTDQLIKDFPDDLQNTISLVRGLTSFDLFIEHRASFKYTFDGCTDYIINKLLETTGSDNQVEVYQMDEALKALRAVKQALIDGDINTAELSPAQLILVKAAQALEAKAACQAHHRDHEATPQS